MGMYFLQTLVFILLFRPVKFLWKTGRSNNSLNFQENQIKEQLDQEKMHHSESSNTRAESPAITTITTTQSVSSTSIHSTTSSCNGHYSNGNNKGNNPNEQQVKNRICRDFVRGSCRRLFCKVSDSLFFIFESIRNSFYFLYSIRMFSLQIW